MRLSCLQKTHGNPRDARINKSVPFWPSATPVILGWRLQPRIQILTPRPPKKRSLDRKTEIWYPPRNLAKDSQHLLPHFQSHLYSDFSAVGFWVATQGKMSDREFGGECFTSVIESESRLLFLILVISVVRTLLENNFLVAWEPPPKMQGIDTASISFSAFTISKSCGRRLWALSCLEAREAASAVIKLVPQIYQRQPLSHCQGNCAVWREEICLASIGRFGYVGLGSWVDAILSRPRKLHSRTPQNCGDGFISRYSTFDRWGHLRPAKATSS